MFMFLLPRDMNKGLPSNRLGTTVITLSVISMRDMINGATQSDKVERITFITRVATGCRIIATTRV